MRNIKPWLKAPAGTILVGLAILLFLATTALAQAPQAPTSKPEAAPAPTTTVTPAPGPKTERGVCQVKIECPPIKTPGKTLCTATIDCPPPQEKPLKPEKKEKK